MLFHILFFTVSVTKREYSGEDVLRQKRMNDNDERMMQMRAKQAEYFRIM